MQGDEPPSLGLCRATMQCPAPGGRLDHDDGQDARAAVPNMIGVRWRARLRRAAMLLGGAAAPVCWLLAMPAAAAPAAAPETAALHTITVADAAEAWYSASPLDICTTPLGCPPDQAPTSPYPADTLHVGVAGGQETARTYLMPDLSQVPFGSHFGTTTMTIPVATGASDGTQSPDAAHVVACLVTQPFADGEQGSTAAPPKVDCSVSDPATYDAKKSTLTVSLSSITTAWSGGALEAGVALVPDPKAAQPTDAWHVAINGRKRQATPHVSTLVTYFGSDAPPGGGGGVTLNGGGSTSAPPPGPAAAPQLPAPSAGQPPVSPPVVAGQPAPPTAVAQQPVAFTRSAPPSIAFVAPLLLLAGGIFFARVFTRDATPLSVQT
jgi:hypothetical protein